MTDTSNHIVVNLLNKKTRVYSVPIGFRSRDELVSFCKFTKNHKTTAARFSKNEFDKMANDSMLKYLFGRKYDIHITDARFAKGDIHYPVKFMEGSVYEKEVSPRGGQPDN